MSTPSDPLPSAIPITSTPEKQNTTTTITTTTPDKKNTTTTTTTTTIAAPSPNPKLLLHLHDLRHAGTKAYLTLIPDTHTVLETALTHITNNLYTSPPASSNRNFTPTVPPTRSVSIIVRDINGVAYTTGTELDDDHKEIHISLTYINKNVAGNVSELKGVLTHELVHCYQHTAPPCDSANCGNVPRPPSGLIEGIADFVRLKAGLAPVHWKRPKSAKERAEKWDQGYQHTAYFLSWLEDTRVGVGAIGLLNDRLLRVGYVGEKDSDRAEGKTGFWKGLFGAEVKQLWEEYGAFLDASKGSSGSPGGGGNWEDEIVNPPEQ